MVDLSVGNSKTLNRAIIGMILVPVLWGIGFPLTHNAVALINPGLYAFVRLFIATICLAGFAKYFFGQFTKPVSSSGVLLGVFTSLNALSQSYALSHLSSATTAFLVTLNLVFIPFIIYFLKIGQIIKADWISILLAFIGSYIFVGMRLDSLSIGYAWGILAAFSIAMNISIATKLLRQYPDSNRFALSFLQTLIATLLLSYYAFTQDWTPLLQPKVAYAVLYQGIVSTAITTFLQLKYQSQG